MSKRDIPLKQTNDKKYISSVIIGDGVTICHCPSCDFKNYISSDDWYYMLNARKDILKENDIKFYCPICGQLVDYEYEEGDLTK